ncbi:unnamed protein product, partial [Coregonus sp. 'balchen']
CCAVLCLGYRLIPTMLLCSPQTVLTTNHSLALLHSKQTKHHLSSRHSVQQSTTQGDSIPVPSRPHRVTGDSIPVPSRPHRVTVSLSRLIPTGVTVSLSRHVPTGVTVSRSVSSPQGDSIPVPSVPYGDSIPVPSRPHRVTVSLSRLVPTGVRRGHGVEPCRIPVPHHLFVSLKSFTHNTMGEDTDVFFSLYDLREGKQISEKFMVRLNKNEGLKNPDKVDRWCALFTDLSNKDMKRDLYIVSQVIRTGKLLFLGCSMAVSQMSPYSQYSALLLTRALRALCSALYTVVYYYYYYYY